MRSGPSRCLVLLLLIFLIIPLTLHSQVVTTFEGIDASQLGSPKLDIDPNGAVGTKQFLEWTNVYFQAFDKTTFQPVWATPQIGTLPWTSNGIGGCGSIAGDGIVIFDRLASRWVIAGHNSPGTSGTYYYCVAVSNTDDLASSSLKWYAYRFLLNPVLGTNSSGHAFFPDWPKLGTWPSGYFLGFDLLDVDNHYQPVGAVACALDRANMLLGATPLPMQCFSDPAIPPTKDRYLSHSFVPADVDGTTPPPAGRDEFFVSTQNPPLDGVTTTSSALNLWDFHVDWVTPANSTFTNSTLNVPTYTPGCYSLSNPGNTFCVPEPFLNPNGTRHKVDSVGDRLMPRFAYRNFGSYESFLVSQAIKVPITGSQRVVVRWYELRGTGSGLPTLFQSNTISPTTSVYRFVPSIAQDRVGNAAAGYSVSNTTIHPGIRAAWWNLPTQTAPHEFVLFAGTGDEGNANNWGDYTSLTVDPVDDCTFWYANEYFPSNQTGTLINWNTRISFFKLATCH